MTKSCSRRIVILRDIPSNTIEEAILVLKNEGDLADEELLDKEIVEKKREFLIVKEAEMLINNFADNSKKLLPKAGLLKKSNKKWYIDLLINTSLIAGISILLMWCLKLFGNH